jgi:hypothetical protein
LADASVDVLIAIILDFYGRKEEAKKFLLRSALGILLSMAIYQAFSQKSRKRRKKR